MIIQIYFFLLNATQYVENLTELKNVFFLVAPRCREYQYEI